jgi:RNA polymerase sigma-70 factor (ECF subfamily)
MYKDEDLIKGCIRKEREAQKALYDRYADILLGICVRYATDTAEAEDILQEGFVRIFTYISDYSGKGSLFNWMRKIMINTAITVYHRNLKHRYHQEIDAVQEPARDEMPGSSDFTREELLGVIRSLPEGYRIIFNLYAVEGFKHKEIAEMLGIDINTSKSQYSRARKFIRKKLEEISRIARPREEKK